ncbi:hypothetical protein NA57DRAFT_71688 [Rhizodiscina lignyota]|uniref:Uncharacterized protein n=1 Tax=Rhizodiscina lignyota TaxID=1504668 RepID=A0A9P4M9G7_9PEZI|nr:hypothetical protein NA57DRAFT_71688 [Rhizodiscina lignyota]
MTDTISKDLDAFLGKLRTANYLNLKLQHSDSQFSSGTPSMDGGTWQTLMQAHVANLSSHKAMLELLAQGLIERGPVDPSLVASMEGMYATTNNALQNALSMQSYFGGIDNAHSENGGGNQQASNEPAHRENIPTPVQETVSETPRPQPTQRSGQLFDLVKRRKREDDDLPLYIATKNHKKAKHDNPSLSRPTASSPPPPQPPQPSTGQQEADIEYEDISGTVRKRLVEHYEKRLQEKATLKESKRKRDSLESVGSALDRGGHVVLSKPAQKRLRASEEEASDSGTGDKVQSDDGEGVSEASQETGDGGGVNLLRESRGLEETVP